MRRFILAGIVCVLAGAGPAAAQEHWTEGPVWECSAYRTEPGQFDAYMRYLRTHFIDTTAEARKQNLFVDQRLFVQMPRDPDDWDVMVCTAYENGAKALDYDPATEAKWEAISAKHYGTDDEEQQRAVVAPRLEMRRYLGTSMMREVNLKPLQ